MRYLIASLFVLVAAPAAAQVYLGHPDTAVERPEFETMDFGFGQVVVRFEDQLIVGAEGFEMGSYSVIAYRRRADDWVEFQRFENVGGIALARVGDLLAIGAHRDEVDGFMNAGAVKLYAFDAVADVWQLQETLTSPMPSESAFFGQRLAVAADTLYVGEPHLNVRPLHTDSVSSGSLGGRVYAFRSDAGWSVEQTLTGDDNVSGAGFGAALAASDGRLVVGAPGESAASASGVVYSFELSGGAATLAEKIENPSTDVRESPFGHAVAVHGDKLLVGATQYVFEDPEGHGVAHLFRLAVDGAEHLSTFTGDGRFGWSVLLLDESQALVGAPGANQVHHLIDQAGVWVTVQRVIEPPQTTFRDGNFGETMMLAGGELFIGAPSALHDYGASDGAIVPLPSFSQGGKLYEVALIAPPLADLTVSTTQAEFYTTEQPVEITFLVAGDASEAVSAAFLDLRTHLEILETPEGCMAVNAIMIRCELGPISAGGGAEFVVSFAAPPESFSNTAIDAYVGSELPDPDTTDNLAATRITVLPNPSIPMPGSGGGSFGWFGALFLLAMLKSRIRHRRSAPCSARTSVLPDSTPNSR